MESVSIAKKLEMIDEVWVPKVVGELNGQHVKLAKLQGAYVWHAHAREDELFLVVQGEIEIQFRDRVVALREGEFCIVPRGVEHRPVAKALASVLLFEPSSTRNTGNVDHALTIEPDKLERI